MNIFIVSVSLIGYLLVYAWFSIKVESWINVLTPTVILGVPTNFLAEILYLYAMGDVDYNVGYLIIYSTYFIMMLFYAFGYLYVKQPSWALMCDTRVSYGWMTAAFFMISGVALYYPIIREFSDSIFDPRSIYTETRTGYGLNYYLSTTLSYIFLVLILFYQNISSFLKALSFFFVTLFAYMHGSKGQIISVFFIWTLWFFVVNRKNVNFFKFAVFSIVVGFLGVSIFYSMLDSVNFSDLGLMIAGYADYSRNAVMLIEREDSVYFGRLLAEDNFYSRIPRILFSEKPKDFGAFELARKYFPDSFNLDQGVPSFGIGIYFADFHLFGVVVLAFFSLIGGWITRLFVVRLLEYNSPVDFFVLIFLCGIVILPIGSGYLLPEHVFFAFCVYWICRISNIKFN